MKIFGCVGWIHIPKDLRKKLDDKAVKGMYLGYSELQRSYKMMELSTGGLIYSRDVTFDEDTFPGEGLDHDDADESHGEQTDTDLKIISAPDLSFYPKETPLVEEKIQEQVNIEKKDNNPTPEPAINDSKGEHKNKNNQLKRKVTFSDYEEVAEYDDETLKPRKSRRLEGKKPSTNVPRVLTIQDKIPEPKSYRQALEGPHAKEWQEAMDEEYQSLLSNSTWTLIDLPPDRNEIGCKWVYKVKYNTDGSVDVSKRAW